MASEAKQYAARNRQGSDWFSHSSSTSNSQPTPVKAESSEIQSTPVVEQATSPSKSEDRTQMIKPKSDSNSWYKYEQGETKQETPPPQASPVTAAPLKSIPDISKPDTEAAGNQQRSKAGMASDWFSHNHAEENPVESVRQHGASKELGANAARMRGESEHWFSHDQAGESHSVVSPGAKGRPNRQGSASNNMQGIFNYGNAGAK